MSNLVEHAKREFKILGWPGNDEEDLINIGIIEAAAIKIINEIKEGNISHLKIEY